MKCSLLTFAQGSHIAECTVSLVDVEYVDVCLVERLRKWCDGGQIYWIFEWVRTWYCDCLRAVTWKSWTFETRFFGFNTVQTGTLEATFFGFNTAQTGTLVARFFGFNTAQTGALEAKNFGFSTAQTGI